MVAQTIVGQVKRQMLPYGLHVFSIKTIRRGTSRNSYLVHAKEGKFVLRLYPLAKKNDVQRQITLLRQLNERKKIAILPIHPRVLKLRGQVGYVYQFIEGVHFHEAKIQRKLYAFGRLIGLFSKATRRILPPEKSNKWILDNIKDSQQTIRYLKQKNDSFSRTLADLMENAIALLEREYDGTLFRTQLIHGDLHMDNVLYDAKNKKAIIIDAELNREIAACEVMVILSYLVTQSTKKNKIIFNEVLKGYETAHPLRQKERENLPLLMIPRKLGEIMWLLEQFKKGKIKSEELKKYMKDSAEQLDIIVEHFQSLKRICKNVS